MLSNDTDMNLFYSTAALNTSIVNLQVLFIHSEWHRMGLISDDDYKRYLNECVSYIEKVQNNTSDLMDSAANKEGK